MPKELMLYVKNLVFLDGAIARLAPDLDILAEITNISMLFAQRHGEQLGRELGIDTRAVEIDLGGVASDSTRASNASPIESSRNGGRSSSSGCASGPDHPSVSRYPSVSRNHVVA
jgi:hypothetical protein